ncbi:formate/nitrite transporter family protein [Sphingomonas sp.]|uniref:formate/nitrite transporter family protein n=1 Tax=Sphingomonas sp. TaxID=28214 RepID=UPI002BE02A38|nr:formate/nitrite transporter family protein [Sphingomonas sp.]HTG39585.1 formate/nitrite transporter family protein [Sphingomonas sp.]
MTEPQADATGPAIAEAAPELFEDKAESGWPRMAMLAVVAGAYIAFGSIAYLVAQVGPPGGATQLLSGLAFSVGLMLTMVTGAELFTGNTMFVLAVDRHRLTPARMLAAWVVVWLGNLVGSVVIAALFVAAGGGSGVEGLVGDKAVEVASAKVAKETLALIASGVLANMLVCLAVWMAMAAKSVPSKIIAVVGPVTVFVAAGFEHSIANQSLLAMGWLLQDGGAITGGAIARNLALSTFGNILGGMAVAMMLGRAQLDE